ncbi:MAG: hypothetical protein E5V17_00835, partial [Mesorhizobium sp.]
MVVLAMASAVRALTLHPVSSRAASSALTTRHVVTVRLGFASGQTVEPLRARNLLPVIQGRKPMANLGRLAVAVLGILAYQNREKIGDLI